MLGSAVNSKNVVIDCWFSIALALEQCLVSSLNLIHDNNNHKQKQSQYIYLVIQEWDVI